MCRRRPDELPPIYIKHFSRTAPPSNRDSFMNRMGTYDTKLESWESIFLNENILDLLNHPESESVHRFAKSLGTHILMNTQFFEMSYSSIEKDFIPKNGLSAFKRRVGCSHTIDTYSSTFIFATMLKTFIIDTFVFMNKI